MYIMVNIQTPPLVVQRSALYLFTFVVRRVVWYIPVDAVVRMDDHGSDGWFHIGECMETNDSIEAVADEQPANYPSLAEKIDRLIKAKRVRERRTYSYKDLAAAVRAHGGASISAAYLWQLHTGVKDNPQKKTLETLADFFGVPVTYFFDTDEATRLYEQLPIALDADVRKIALRAADLSPESRAVIGEMIEQARKIEAMHGSRRGMGPPHNRGDAQGEGTDQA
jgi:transcriptional regulator with XRE-family HTH domain